MPSIQNSTYTESDVFKWAESYSKCGSFAKVGKEYGVCRDTIRKWLTKYKDTHGLSFTHDIYGIETKNTKVCTKCGEEKLKTDFVKTGNRLRPECKVCTYRGRNPELDKERERIGAGFKTCTGKSGCGKVKPFSDFEKLKSSSSGHAYRCKKCSSKHIKNVFKDRNRPNIRVKKCNGIYGCGKTKLISEFYYIKNRRRYIAYCRACNSKRRNIRVNAKIASNLRSRLTTAVKKSKRKGSAVRDLGCSVIELKVYLEKQFYYKQDTGEAMSWKNYSYNGWHIDHIIPLSKFDLSTEIEVKKACHYTNLQPLWAEDNFKKSNKLNWEK